MLRAYPPKLSHKAARCWTELGVDGADRCHRHGRSQPDHVMVGTTAAGTEVDARATVLWAAGVKASPLGKMLADGDGGGGRTAPAGCWSSRT